VIYILKLCKSFHKLHCTAPSPTPKNFQPRIMISHDDQPTLSLFGLRSDHE